MTKVSLVATLLASTALVSSFGRAEAQTTAGAPATTNASSNTGQAVTPSRRTLEEVVVIAHKRSNMGGGLIKPQVSVKSISTVSSEFIQTQPAIENVYQYVALTPGALVSTTDPFGLSEQFSINVHGLGQDELGYVLEGMPLNDIGYYTAFPSQFIDSENVDEVSLAQGTVDLDSPIISATGGLMTITMLDPSVRQGGLMDASYGSYDTYRGFLRVDTGMIGNTGIRSFVSYSYTHSDDWHGPGDVRRQHVDFKFVKEWDNGSRATLSGEWHSGITPTYIEPTLAAFQDFGANGAPNNRDAVFSPGDGNYWPLNTGTFRILYLAAPTRIVFSPTLTLNLTPYWQYGYGNSPYGTTLTEAGNYEGTAGPYFINIPNYAANGGAVMADFKDDQYRMGLVTKATITTGANHFIVGVWLDHSDESDLQPVTALSPDGQPPGLWAQDPQDFLRLPNGQVYFLGADHVGTYVVQPFIGDNFSLLDDRLMVELGFKEAWVWRDGQNLVPGPQYEVNLHDVEPLPRAGVRFKADENDEFFASVSTNYRTPSEATMFNAYYGGYQYATANANLKTEYSISEDAGYRYTGPIGTGSISFFNFNFSNRQVATVVGGNLINESINAGHQWTYGLDVEFGARPWHHFSPYVSGEYLHSIDEDNLEVGTDYLPTAGKTTIRSPKFQGALGISYDDGTFFGNFNVKSVTSQYATFMDDEKIPGYSTLNLAMGARLPSFGLKAGPEIKLNLNNLTGIKYLSAVANPTSNAQTQTGVGGTIIPGASPTYYLSGGFAAMVTLTQAF